MTARPCAPPGASRPPDARRGERAAVYAAAGMLGEVVQTGVRSVSRDGDRRLTGHTYLWMAPVYASTAWLFEPAHARLRTRPAWLRAAVWTAGAFAVEAASGGLIRAVTGEVPWDYARPRGRPGRPRPAVRHWRGLVRPAYAPFWALGGLAAERLHDRLDPPAAQRAG